MTKPRGRPKRSDIADLILQGMNSNSRFQCDICKRSFSRMKNLRTHVSTHSDEKKYRCDFPDCFQSFKQSSHLITHLLLHSKEKPFKCPVKDCLVRFRHANRKCPDHSSFKIIKQLETAEEFRSRIYRNVENLSEAQKIWFEEYISKREQKSSPAFPKRIGNVLPVFHKEDMKGSDSEDKIMDERSSEDNIMDERSSEDNFMNVSSSEDNFMNVSSSEDNIMNVSSSEDSVTDVSGSEDNITNVCDSENSFINVSDSENSFINVSDIEDSITNGSDSDNNIMSISDNEEIHQNDNILQASQDCIIFMKFLEILNQKGENSKSLFEKYYQAVTNPSKMSVDKF